ncbi:hypothetical protein F0L68_15065 [Solihabitans fulvus]|uniref:Uncharacterized protein n=1 Tax=Solihabitans fulvus TaxID=1892852 RepID=A0A5B2XFZ5_9PSEU|nr:hypothetical protein [Solihabitans fulvus]KAA2261840.1 hypothetical protein F0L68_15065 [Solihabitans fulvus]
MIRTPLIREAREYLRGHGWTVTRYWRGAEIWTWQDFDVLVPPTDTMGDSVMLLRELVVLVAAAEERSPQLVARAMITPAVDVVSYRLSDAEWGEIALPAGLRAMRAVRDLIAACARGVAEHSHGTRPTMVGSLLERTLLSLADDAFGVDVLLPVEPGPVESLGRLTALRLLHSSLAQLEMATEGSFEDGADEAVADGTCLAFGDLAGPWRRSPFRLEFCWSWAVPAGQGPVAVEFPDGAGERIHARGKKLSQTVPAASAVVEGLVTSLSDDKDGDRWVVGVRGRSVVDGAVEAPERVVSIRLAGAQQYAAALDAHRRGRTVRAKGSVARVGRRRGVVVGPDGFAVSTLESVRQRQE